VAERKSIEPFDEDDDAEYRGLGKIDVSSGDEEGEAKGEEDEGQGHEGEEEEKETEGENLF